ncbi:excinuclease ATPase subunit [Paraherbaspirillum soli]|uniref:Excinuclease ATPase subunit n=1 Tax=Paraherbaspirillum soli TaxID=631222 RepID=A0ABW0MC03_9BURK
MRKNVFAAALMLSLGLGVLSSAQARDIKHLFPLADAMKEADASKKLDGSVKFFFAGQDHPAVAETFISDVSNKKTNSRTTDEVACNWAFLSALISFQERAHALGADAVVNIVSYYKKDEMASATEFECHAGAIMVGVALKGDFVKLAK